MCTGGRGRERTGNWDPVTTQGAFAATLEGVAVQLVVDQLLEAPEKHAEEEWSGDQASVCPKPPSLQNQKLT